MKSVYQLPRMRSLIVAFLIVLAILGEPVFGNSAIDAQQLPNFRALSLSTQDSAPVAAPAAKPPAGTSPATDSKSTTVKKKNSKLKWILIAAGGGAVAAIFAL